jgi:hypothetical protein
MRRPVFVDIGRNEMLNIYTNNLINLAPKAPIIIVLKEMSSEFFLTS